MNKKIKMYYFKEVLHDDNVFVIYRHEQDVFAVFLLEGIFGFRTVKIVHNTKQCRDAIKNYKKYIS